jgi:hypothetical protein
MVKWNVENPSDWEEIEDFFSDTLTDSFDMDWTGRDGAKALIHALQEEGLQIVSNTQAPEGA